MWAMKEEREKKNDQYANLAASINGLNSAENTEKTDTNTPAVTAATVQLPAFASCALNKMNVFIYFIVCVFQSTYSLGHISIACNI